MKCIALICSSAVTAAGPGAVLHCCAHSMSIEIVVHCVDISYMQYVHARVVQISAGTAAHVWGVTSGHVIHRWRPAGATEGVWEHVPGEVLACWWLCMCMCMRACCIA